MSASTGDSLESLVNEYREGKAIDSNYFRTASNLARHYRFQDRERSFKILDSALLYINDFLPNGQAGDVYNVYGNLYFDIGDYSNALKNYYLCLENALEIKDMGAVAFSYSDVAYCYYSLEFFEIAKYYYLKSFEYASMDGVYNAPYPKSHAAISLALTFGNLGNLDSAYYYMELGEEIRKDYDEPVLLAQVYSYYGMLSLRNEKNYKKSREYFYKAIDIYKNTPNNTKWEEALAYIYNYLAKAEFAAGNYDLAFKYNRMSAENFKNQFKYRMPSVY